MIQTSSDRVPVPRGLGREYFQNENYQKQILGADRYIRLYFHDIGGFALQPCAKSSLSMSAKLAFKLAMHAVGFTIWSVALDN